MTIVFLPEVEEYLYELIEILFQNEYFGFKENAVKYIMSLEDDIKTNLPTKTKRLAPPYFNRYGENMFYSVYKKSKSTQWYVFYNIYESADETILLIRYISNNHVTAQLL